MLLKKNVIPKSPHVIVQGLKHYWRRILCIGGGVLVVGIVVWQLVYPADKLLPFVVVDGVSIGSLEKKQAIDLLNQEYAAKNVQIFAGDEPEVFKVSTLEEIGLRSDNTQRIERLTYPWYMRLIPSSLWWFGALQKTSSVEHTADETSIDEYVRQTFGDECRLSPKNPRAEAARDKITIIDGAVGGICERTAVVTDIKQVIPDLESDMRIRLTVTPVYPAIEVAELERLVATIESNLEKGVWLINGEERTELDVADVRSWLIFSTENNTLDVTLDRDKAGSVLDDALGQQVARSAGVTKVTTHDFTEVSRAEGVKGQELDGEATIGAIVGFLRGASEQIQIVARPVEPSVEYTRTYSSSNEGLSALIKNYTTDKPGVYGVSLIELSGQRRRAGYNDTRAFTTASTYKTYVAYAVLKRIESGEFSWGESVVSSKNLEKCFDDMIVLSDNPCAEAFVKKIGYTPLHRDVQALGLTGTSFIDKESYKTTANDLSSFMAMLESGQLPISSENRTRFIDALKRNVYRRGIPDGVSGQVADKVGFLDGLLHDTAIVYSPNGTYVLTILTDGSSWANIAELTRQIENLRQ